MEAARPLKNAASAAGGTIPRGPSLFSWAILAAAVLLVFGRSYGYPFLHWDDNTAVTENPLLSPPSWSHLATFWSTPWSGLYIPTSFTVYWIEARLSSLLTGSAAPDPRIFHAGLLLLHIGCAGLVFRILRRLVDDSPAALLGALLFAIHPLQAESVAWITETRGVLATLFGLLALDVHLAGEMRPEGPSFLRHHVVSTVFLALALFAKPIAVAIPIVAFLVDRFRLEKPVSRILPILSVWLLVALVAVLVNRSEQGGPDIQSKTPLAARPFVAFDALAFYLEKLAWPVRLATEYGRNPTWLSKQPAYWLHGLVPLALAGGLAFLPGRRTWLLALGIFTACLLPVLGLVWFNFQAISTVADRYMHLAMIAPAFALAALVARLRSPIGTALASAIVVASGFQSAREVDHWRDTDALFARTLEVNPRSYIACSNLGVSHAAAGELEEALRWFRRALDLDPGYEVAAGNIGRILLEQEKIDEAVAILRATAREHPDYADARADLARALVLRGVHATSDEKKLSALRDAELELRDTLRILPGYGDAHLMLAQILYSTGRIGEALAEFGSALEGYASPAEVHDGLAMCYAKLGNRELSEEHARAAAAFREAK